MRTLAQNVTRFSRRRGHLPGTTMLQRARGGRATEPELAPPIVHQVLASPGEALDHHARAGFEQRFGHDFSNVRVHTGAQAAKSAAAVNALAYTAGHHVVFGAGRGPLADGAGGRLLGHELVHVMQWGGRPVPARLPIGRADGPAEQEARADVSVSHNATTSLQRAVPVCDQYSAAEKATVKPCPGIRIKVDRINKQAKVDANIETHGASADAAKTRTLHNSVASNWNGSFADGYSMTTNVSTSYRAAGTAASSDAAQIEMLNAGTDKPATADQSAGTIWLNLDYSNVQLSWAAAHEVGHLMGLRDRYSSDFWAKVGAFFSGTRAPTEPDAGYEQNIMGVHNGKLESRNVRDLIALHIPYRCTRWRLENPL